MGNNSWFDPAPPLNNSNPQGGVGYLPPHIQSNPNFQPNQPNFGNPYQSAGPPAVSQPSMQSQPSSNYALPQSNPVLRPYQPFNPNDDCAKLYKAMKGIGTDEKILINILCKRTSGQRQEIALSYKTGYGKDLLKNLESELKGNLERLFKVLMRLPAQTEAKDLMNSMDGIGTNESTLIDIICTKNNDEMTELKNSFRSLFGKDLEKELRGESSGYFKRFLTSLSTAHRSNAPADMNKAQQQAKELYEAGAKRAGTNEVTFNRIFAAESFEQLRATFDCYQRLTGHDIEKAIKSEMSGDVERAFLAVAQTAKNPALYWANRLKDTMQGSGTQDRSLCRIIVFRSERDMQDIKQIFQSRFGKSLESWIKSDTTGDYERALIALVT
jgi:annexin A7/11